MNELVTLVILIVISAASAWLQKRREEGDEEGEETLERAPRPHSEEHETSSEAPSPSSSRGLEERIRDLLGDDTEEEPETAAEAGANRRAQTGSDPKPTSNRRPYAVTEESLPPSPPREAEQSTSEISAGSRAPTPSGEGIDGRLSQTGTPRPSAADHAAYQRPNQDPYAAEESPMYADVGHKAAYKRKHAQPYGKSAPLRTQRALLRALKQRRSARQLFMGSVVLAPPKALEESRSPFF